MAEETTFLSVTNIIVRRQVNVLSQRSKFAVGTTQADHLIRLDSVAQGGNTL